MATPIQVCLFALVAAVNSQDIPLDFLNQALGEPPPVNFNRPRYQFEGFGLNSNRLYEHHNLFNDRPPDAVPFGPQYGPNPYFVQNNAHTKPENNNFDSSKTERQDRPPAPVTEIDEFDTKPEDAVIDTHNTADKPKENAEYPKIDKGPLKVGLLTEPGTAKEELVTENIEEVTEKEEHVLKTNENNTLEPTAPTVEPLLSSSLEQKLESPLEPIHVENLSSEASEIVNITNTEKSLDGIVFPDQVDQIKAEMNGTLYNNNKTNYLNPLNGTSSYNEVNISKNMDSVFVPVQVIPNVVSVMNRDVNTNSNRLVPLAIGNGQITQVLPITNDIFPTTTTEKANSGNLPIQGFLYTKAITVLPQNSAVPMPIKFSDNNNDYQRFVSNALFNIPNNINPNVGIPSDIPQSPVIAMLLTPANIKKIGTGNSNHLYNTQQQSNPVSAASTLNTPGTQIYTTNLQNFAQQTMPNSQLNTQNPQYYLVGNSNNPVNGNSNNGQPMVLNLQGNLATNNPNVLPTDNTQKYMLVTVNNQEYLPQNTQGNIYTLASNTMNNVNNQPIQDTQGNVYTLATNNLNSAQQGPLLLNNNNNSQSNLYTVVTMPNAVQNAANNNNLSVDNAALNPVYQDQSTQDYSLVSMKDDNNTKTSESR